MARITLVRPPVNVLHKFSKPVECLALGYLTSALRSKNHEVTMLDGMLFDYNEAEMIQRILDSNPEIVGFTNVLNYFPEETKSLIKDLRISFKGLIVLGGHSVSFFPEEILRSLPELDAIIIGEGENSFSDLVNCYLAGEDFAKVNGVSFIKENVFIKTLPHRITNLDHVLPPARDLVEELIERDGLICVSTSRGCYARCTFCSIPRFYGLSNGKKMHSGDWLCRDVDLVVKEIYDLNRRYGLLELLIVDDEFFGGCELGQKRAILFGKKMKDLNIPLKFTISCRAENVNYEVFKALKEGGLTHVFIGIESGVPEDLKLMAKGHSPTQNKEAVSIVKSLGISFQAGFMMFNHRTTLDQLKMNLEFLREIGECKPIVINSSVEPHFGAPVTALMNREGGVITNDTRLDAAYTNSFIAIMREIAEICAFEFQKYMVFIAGINSAVTYEWRRTVPFRSEEEQSIIDTLEHQINKQFTDAFEAVLDEIIAGRIVDKENAMKFLSNEIARVHENIQLTQAIVLNVLNKGKAGIKYWSQKEMITHKLSMQNYEKIR